MIETRRKNHGTKRSHSRCVPNDGRKTTPIWKRQCPVFRVLRPGGTFCGCFYVMGEHKRADWFVRHIYEKAGFFTPPYETVSSLKARLDGMYTDVDMGNLKSMAWFICRKAG